MVSLLDIAPITRTVPINGQGVTVRGISAHGIATLLERFPALQGAITGASELSAENLYTAAPAAIASLIAAGCGLPGEPGAEAIAASLPATEQLELLAATLELTFPRGLGPFLEKLAQLKSAAGFADGTKAPAGS